MAQIPSGQKFHTVASNVQTAERGSALANSQREIFTMQDIVSTVANPTSGFIPYNSGGVFINSNFVVIPDTIYGSTPFGYYSISNPVFGGGYNTYVDDYNGWYSFGVASTFGGYSTAFAGLAISTNDAIIGCGMSSPTNGVFKASSVNGYVRIGNSDGVSIGVDTINSKFRVGSTLTTTGTHTTISSWLKVVTESGTNYYLPLYS